MHYYKVTLSQQLRLLLPMILKNAAPFVYIYLKAYSFSVLFYFWLILFLGIIDILPTLIVHIQYLIKNWNITYTIDIEKKIICKKWKDKFNNKPFSDIVYINYYLSFVRPTGIHSFGEYRYYKIGFKDEDSFIITCLMTYDIDTNFGALLPMEAEKHDRLIAFVY